MDLDPAAFAHYQGWVTAGRAGSMAYMARDPERRRSMGVLLPGARTVVSLGVNYYRFERPSLPHAAGRVARYAYGRDYHKILAGRLKRLVAALQKAYPDHEWRSTVDTSAVLEKAYAQQAGLGFIGKNTLLITPEYGSWVFLAEVVTTLSMDPPPSTLRSQDSCGHCRLCLDICPTGALVGEYELDARRCIAYLTIEHRGSIPEALRPLMGDWLFGCDLCQEVCPQNTRAQATTDGEWTSVRLGGDHHLLSDILALETDDQCVTRFAGSPLLRAKREGLVRNACIVAANVGAHNLLPQLEQRAHTDASPVVREHAAWAVQRLSSSANQPNK